MKDKASYLTLFSLLFFVADPPKDGIVSRMGRSICLSYVDIVTSVMHPAVEFFGTGMYEISLQVFPARDIGTTILGISLVICDGGLTNPNWSQKGD